MLRAMGWAGADADTAQRLGRVPAVRAHARAAPPSSPARPVFLADLDEVRERFPAVLPTLERLGRHTLAALPLISADVRLGALIVNFASQPHAGHRRAAVPHHDRGDGRPGAAARQPAGRRGPQRARPAAQPAAAGAAAGRRARPRRPLRRQRRGGPHRRRLVRRRRPAGRRGRAGDGRRRGPRPRGRRAHGAGAQRGPGVRAGGPAARDRAVPHQRLPGRARARAHGHGGVRPAAPGRAPDHDGERRPPADAGRRRPTAPCGRCRPRPGRRSACTTTGCTGSETTSTLDARSALAMYTDGLVETRDGRPRRGHRPGARGAARQPRPAVRGAGRRPAGLPRRQLRRRRPARRPADGGARRAPPADPAAAGDARRRCSSPAASCASCCGPGRCRRTSSSAASSWSASWSPTPRGTARTTCRSP